VGVRQALGCGGSVEGGGIALQGDQRERVRRWLEGRGVRKVTVG
jgi:translation initiation factor 1